MRNFGIGGLYLIPSGANPTPVEVAILKDISIDFKYDLKPLRGQWQLPIDVARGPCDISIKAKFADVRAALLTSVLVGATSAAGQKTDIGGEVGTIPGTPYQITVAQGATFFEDADVYDVTAGIWLTRVAAGPTTGQYTVNTATGLYTFAAADTTHSVQFYYSYTQSAVGKTTTMNNALMGPSTGFLTRLWNTFNSKKLGLRFPSVHFPKLSMAWKAEDWVEHDLEGMVVQDPTSSKIFDIDTGE